MTTCSYLSLFLSTFIWGTCAKVPAIFVFGDSLADVGNNNFLPTVQEAKADYVHNGIDFYNSTHTGRFSNGFNYIDFLAMELGFKQSPPAYLSISKVEQMLLGVNFASGGSGLLDTTGTNVLTPTIQLEKFVKVVDALTSKLGKMKAYHLFAHSVYLISNANNDMFEYYLLLGPQNATANKQFVEKLVMKYEEFVKSLYKYGARKFGLLGLSHIGCIPYTRNLNPTGKCMEDLNVLARDFNKLMKARFHKLRWKLPGMMFSYGNVYDMMTLALDYPSMFGYKDVENACCGSGKFNGDIMCTPNATYCADRTSYLFWDRYHPTQTASNITAAGIYNGPSEFSSPINLKILAEKIVWL